MQSESGKTSSELVKEKIEELEKLGYKVVIVGAGDTGKNETGKSMDIGTIGHVCSAEISAIMAARMTADIKHEIIIVSPPVEEKKSLSEILMENSKPFVLTAHPPLDDYDVKISLNEKQFAGFKHKKIKGYQKRK